MSGPVTFTPEMEAYFVARYPTTGLVRLSEEIGINRDTLRKQVDALCEKHGLVRRIQRPCPVDWKAAVADFNAGMKQAELAAKIGRNVSSLRVRFDVLRAQGWKIRKGRLQDNTTSYRRERDIKIMELLLSGMRQKQIRQHLNLSKNVVAGVIYREMKRMRFGLQTNGQPQRQVIDQRAPRPAL